MRSLLQKCQNCHTYSMVTTCPKCGKNTAAAHPARYSPDDKYARYRTPLAYEERSQTT